MINNNYEFLVIIDDSLGMVLSHVGSVLNAGSFLDDVHI